MKIKPRPLTFLILAGSIVSLASPEPAPDPAADSPYLALVGTYTGKTGSKGIYAFHFDAKNGKLELKGLAGSHRVYRVIL